MLTAITRKPSLCLQDCVLTYLQRQSIDLEEAFREHRSYERCLAEMGVQVVSVPAESDLPDAVFVEDTAAIVDEVAVIARMKVIRRRPEISRLIPIFSHYRPLKYLSLPAVLEGGDIIRVGRTLYVGISMRTNLDGAVQLEEILRSYDYQVRPVKVRGCLHLTTGCSYIGRDTILANETWVDTSQFEGFEVINTCSVSEPWAANTMLIDETVILSESFPRTRDCLESRGFKVKTVKISELEKAEGGLSCLSKIIQTTKTAPELKYSGRIV
jgi:dimethylargininase